MISSALNEHSTVKVNIVVECTFMNIHGESSNYALKMKNRPITSTSDIEKIVSEKFQKIKTEIEEAQLNGSGWTLHTVDGIRLKIDKYNP